MAFHADTKTASLQSRIDEAVRTIPPLWPLEATVAVNPFLGCADRTLGETSAFLASLTGHDLVMPLSWFAEKIETGEIEDMDLKAAIEALGKGGDLSPSSLRQALKKTDTSPTGRLPTLVDLAGESAALDLRAILADRITAWASNYFDEGQALWQVTNRGGAWQAWCDFASNDLTPEILGLDGFCQFVSDLPGDANLFIEQAMETLAIAPEAAATYFTQLLFDLGGWSQLARYRLWQAELAGKQDPIVGEMLAIRLAWEVFAQRMGVQDASQDWAAIVARRQRAGEPSAKTHLADVLQFAFDHAEQRRLNDLLSKGKAKEAGHDRPTLQAAFCIDVRSEVFRRAMEGVDTSVETIGFAGFFGLGIEHRPFASDVPERRLPVLLNPGLVTTETTVANQSEDQSKRYRLRAVRAWGRFKLAAVSSFAFVESAGPIYVSKLLQGALGVKFKGSGRKAKPQLASDVPLEARTDAAETILRAMSLTSNFARLVILAGHGAHVTNNPHESALQCGACGGYSGDVNARLLAGLLNEGEVRSMLKGRGIDIPDDTLFIGALHDTTSDHVELFEDDTSEAHAADIGYAMQVLKQAGARARAERSATMPGRPKAGALNSIGRSWSQTRPEWGLAGCNAFIAAPRSRTSGKALKGRSFLHSYDWREDKAFKVLELILTAPVVVASWISLQYYGSTVAPDLFGAGNKLLHNVVGGVGVIEGNGGLLRTGLPLQSVSDGETFRHVPSRLSVCIEAPREAITDVLKAHPSVKALFDNQWLHLFAMDDQGALSWRYTGDGGWEDAFAGGQAVLPDSVAA